MIIIRWNEQAFTRSLDSCLVRCPFRRILCRDRRFVKEGVKRELSFLLYKCVLYKCVLYKCVLTISPGVSEDHAETYNYPYRRYFCLLHFRGVLVKMS